MIVFSRQRHDTDWDEKLAEALARRFDAPVLSIPFLYDLRSFGPTVDRLREINEPSVFIAPLPKRASESLLNKLFGRPVCPEIFTTIVEYRHHSTDETVDALIDTLVSDIDSPECRSRVRNDARNSEGSRVERLDEPTVNRWYPVVDDRCCSGCLECVNFCLFGVYVIGANDRPVVDQPDACRDGCPACSRGCPARAILFPMHEDDGISGYGIADDAIREPTKSASIQAGEERNRHLDDLVDQIDHFSVD